LREEVRRKLETRRVCKERRQRKTMIAELKGRSSSSEKKEELEEKKRSMNSSRKIDESISRGQVKDDLQRRSREEKRGLPGEKKKIKGMTANQRKKKKKN